MKLNKNDLDNLAGKPADLSPWAYTWRCDGNNSAPEADFLPRRIKRQDEVYRTLLPTLGEDGVKSYFYKQYDLLKPQLPAAEGRLITGLIWVGGVSDYEVTVKWEGCNVIPSPCDVEVRDYPTAWGWFGFSVDRRLEGPEVSEDGLTWVYRPKEGDTMDWAYSTQVKTATEAISLFSKVECDIPALSITGGSLGEWKRLDFTLEWGFDDALPVFVGEVASHVAYISEKSFDAGAKRASYSCLYSEEARYGFDSKFTCIIDAEAGLGATVLLRELAYEPICVPEAGLFFCPASMEMTAAEYIEKAKSEGKKSVRQRVFEHEEASSWEELIRNVRLWRCPDDTELPPFPDAPRASAPLHVPDKRWETMYELAVDQLSGHNMWGMLSSEVSRATYAMELIGLHEEADRVYDYYLPSPGIKPDGDFSTGDGMLEWAKSMRHDMGYAHEGTHTSVGWLIFSMMQRYYIKQDVEWLRERLPRLKRAVDWNIGELRGYMKDTKDREALHCFGLMPPSMNGDYALPASDWRWYYNDNAHTFMGLNAFADVLERIGDPEAPKYRAEVEIYRRDLTNAVNREALYAPVRRSGDGMSRSFIPRMAYAGGLLHYREETNIPHFASGIIDLFTGALPLAVLGSLIDASDRRIVGTLDGMEEGGMQISVAELEKLDHPTADAASKEDAEQLASLASEGKKTSKAPASSDDLWFWNTFSNLPKISHNADLYLREDDIPNFLHFFFNHAIVMVGSNGKLWEHAHPDVYVECLHPDNGSAAWFVENFRSMLLMEDNGVLWLARGTPRAWLEDGCEISADAVPTYYGTLTYKVRSSVKRGIITADIDIPTRELPEVVKLKLRHPKSEAIKAVELFGKCESYSFEGEIITMTNPAGRIEIKAKY